MALPYKIATLLYFFNEQDEVLLLERTQEPNRGMWSPCGGKLKTAAGESPYVCACREAFEETGLKIKPTDLHLSGLVSEHGYQGQAPLVDVIIRSKTQVERIAGAASRGSVPFLLANRLVEAALAANGSGKDLAVVLAASRRLLCRSLSLPCWRPQ